jgi:hypothetical protein
MLGAMTPTEALQTTLMYPFMTCNKRALEKPGAVVARMGKEIKEALSRLTSDELAKVRVEWWELQDEFYARGEHFRQLKKAFDQKVLAARRR